MLLAQLSPFLLGVIGSYWIAVLVLATSAVVGVVLLLVQFRILVRIDFRRICRTNRIGRRMKQLFTLISLGFLALVLVVYLGNIYHVWPAVTIEPSIVTPFLFA